MKYDSKQLRKRIPKTSIFIKNLENDLLDNFDEYNDNFLLIKKYSKEYNLMREYLKKTVTEITFRYMNFNRQKQKIYNSIKNLKKYESLAK